MPIKVIVQNLFKMIMTGTNSSLCGCMSSIYWNMWCELLAEYKPHVWGGNRAGKWGRGAGASDRDRENSWLWWWGVEGAGGGGLIFCKSSLEVYPLTAWINRSDRTICLRSACGLTSSSCMIDGHGSRSLFLHRSSLGRGGCHFFLCLIPINVYNNNSTDVAPRRSKWTMVT